MVLALDYYSGIAIITQMTLGSIPDNMNLDKYYE